MPDPLSVATPGAGITNIAVGVRNSQGLARLPAGEMLFIDHGPSGARDEGGRIGRDELNVLREDANYGWPIESGIHVDGRFVQPMYEWTVSAAPAGLVALARTSGTSDTVDVFSSTLRAQALYRIVLVKGTDSWSVSCAQPLDFADHGRLRGIAAHPRGGLLVSTSNRDSRGVPRPGDDRILLIRPSENR